MTVDDKQAEVLEVYGYARISVDEELDRDNTSIENQLGIISDYVKQTFPNAKLITFQDRDKSGYTFEQRDGYQEMRKLLLSGPVKVLIVKDFSRFSRRNSRGLVELEDLRDAGVRIISIADAIDYPTYDDWMQIQFRFLVNELPVTDTSKKVKNSIAKMQKEGQWVHVVPYGYVTKYERPSDRIPKTCIEPEEAEIVRKIFDLYAQGWGYKKIANYLTDNNIPTPRMMEKRRAEEQGLDYKRPVKPEWSIITVSSILSNDYYIGTLRQHKFKRKNINGADVKTQKNEQYVFEGHHEAIIDYKTFRYVQEQLTQRAKTHYRGVKKYETPYTGFLYCGDCGEPMKSMSRPDLAPAYICAKYHRRGRKGCTSHHTRLDFMDDLLKSYIRRVRDNSSDMLEELEKALKSESKEVKTNDNVLSVLERNLSAAKEELKATKKRKIREISRNPEDEEIIEDTYVELEQELIDRIKGLQKQIELTTNKRNSIIQVNRVARTVMDIFDDILEKDRLDKMDISFLVERITVYEDKIDIKLKADIDNLLRLGRIVEVQKEENTVNFNADSTDIAGTAITGRVTQKTRNQPSKVYTVTVVNSGTPLEIFTDREGEIILKKYSPMMELTAFAGQYADAMAQSTGLIVCITDRDQVVAVAGGSRKELLQKTISRSLEQAINDRITYQAGKDEKNVIQLVDEELEGITAQVIAPIICEGDAIGSVSLMSREPKARFGEMEMKLAVTAAGFLGRQMES